MLVVPQMPKSTLTDHSISAKTISSLIEYSEPEHTVEFIWQLNNPNEHSLHARLLICGSYMPQVE
jgi:hypothetical protein